MLVLSRRESQSIVIGKDIVVTVVSIRGDQVRIGIDAPRSVTVHRQEVAVAIEQANREAAAGADIDPHSLPTALPRPPGQAGGPARSVGGRRPGQPGGQGKPIPRPPGPGGSSGAVSSPGRGTTPRPGPGSPRPPGQPSRPSGRPAPGETGRAGS